MTLLVSAPGNALYLGKEKFSYPQPGYAFLNWIPPNFLKRMKGLRDSGIVDWWERFLSDRVLNLEKIKALTTKELNRNDQSASYVIYMILVFGHGIALLVFIFVDVKRPVHDVLRRLCSLVQVWTANRREMVKNKDRNVCKNNVVFVEVRSAE